MKRNLLLVALFAATVAQPAFAAAPGGKPNIVIILADDLGFSDLGCYGSEIFTPYLDRLAGAGMRFTQFYNTARCCPTRACLLTGLYPHQAGIGHMTDDYRRPGYRGDLNQQCVTIAEVLRGGGYQTLMCGKWHVTPHIGPEGPKHNWPKQRGFDHFFGTIAGAGDYFNPVSLTQENQQIRPTGDFYYTEAIAQKAGEMIEEAARYDKPFFLYVAFTAPHWPLHARPNDIAKYQGKYSAGWDELREKRHKRMIDLGIVDRRWPLTPRDSRVLAWEKAPYHEWHQRRMEVYAAQVESMDRGVGRIVDKLQQAGRLDNTLLMFLADNGGCAEEIAANWTGPHIPEVARDGRSVQVGNRPSVMPGAADSYQSYGVPWANLSNTPFRLYKHWVHEGGIAAPLIVYWPHHVPKGNTIVPDPAHVVDIMATCLEASETPYPKTLAGYPILPTEGESMVPIFRGQGRVRSPIFWEHEGNRAVRDGKWKLVARHGGDWELYDMEADRTEMTDRAAEVPAMVKNLSDLYDAWAKRVRVEPWEKVSPGARKAKVKP